VFSASHDDAGAALACYVLGLADLHLGQMHEMDEVTRRGVALADRTDDVREQAAARTNLAVALVAGDIPVEDCLRECQALAPWCGMELPPVLCELASLHAMRGQFETARELIARARQILVERIRGRRPLRYATRSSALVESLAGNLHAAERELRAGLQIAQEMREREWLSQTAASLSRLLSIQGSDEAETFSVLSHDTAPAENITAQAMWRAARARVLIRRGECEQAEILANEAVGLVPHAMLLLGAEVRVDLFEVLLAAGQRSAALCVLNDAIGLYKRKGDIVSTAHARLLERRGL
jgi:hypothetical protein